MQHYHYTIEWRGSSCASYTHTDYFCYLIHFETKLGNPEKPRGQAGHYLGVTSALDCRLLLHKNGNGAAIMAAVGKAGVAWEVSRLWRIDTWKESRDLEHALKRRHNNTQLCPICNPRLGPDLLVGLRAGHWPLKLHSRIGMRRPAPVYRNISMKGGESR